MKEKLLPDDKVKEIVKVKKHRNRPDLANYGQEFVEPGDNRKFLTFALEFYGLPKLDFNDVPAVQDRIAYYFRRCSEDDMKPGVVGLSNALGIDRKTLWAYKAGTRRAENPKLAEVINQAYNLLEQMWEDYMQNGKISPPNGIFLGKNHYGYKDVQDVVVQPVNPYENEQPDTIRDKYLNGINDVVDKDGKVE